MLEIEGLTVGFGGSKPALDAVSLELGAGGRLLVCGAGGSGKSTLIAAAGGVIPRLTRPAAYVGTVRLAGRPLQDWPNAELFSRAAFVFQNLDDQLWNLSVEDLIAFAPENRGAPRERLRAMVAATMERFSLAGLSGRQVLTLSGGERRMVALAAALAGEPSLLALDEPTTGLDPEARGRLVGALSEAGQGEAPPAVLVAEQDAGALSSVLDRTILLAEGRIVAETSLSRAPSEIELWRAAGVIAPGEALARRPPAARGEIALEAAGLRSALRRATGEPVLSDVSFAISEGEIVGLIGRNGAGKSTLFQSLLGLRPLTGGRVAIAGADASGWSPARRARSVGYLPQNMRRVLFNMSVVEEAAFAVAADTRRLSDPTIRAKALEALDRYGLADKAEANPFALSAREQALLGLACVESSGCAVAILDEPLIARDRRGRAMLDRFLDGSQQSGRAIVLISHDLDLVEAVAERTILLDAGVVAFDGPTRDLWGSAAFKALCWPSPPTLAAHAA